jgi:hypothetical protein
MNPISDTARPESTARNRRVAALVSALTPHLPSGTGEQEATELCSAFDQAVECCRGVPGGRLGTCQCEEESRADHAGGTRRAVCPFEAAGSAPRRLAAIADFR